MIRPSSAGPAFPAVTNNRPNPSFPDAEIRPHRHSGIDPAANQFVVFEVHCLQSALSACDILFDMDLGCPHDQAGPPVQKSGQIRACVLNPRFSDYRQRGRLGMAFPQKDQAIAKCDERVPRLRVQIDVVIQRQRSEALKFVVSFVLPDQQHCLEDGGGCGNWCEPSQVHLADQFAAHGMFGQFHQGQATSGGLLLEAVHGKWRKNILLSYAGTARKLARRATACVREADTAFPTRALADTTAAVTNPISLAPIPATVSGRPKFSLHGPCNMRSMSGY